MEGQRRFGDAQRHTQDGRTRLVAVTPVEAKATTKGPAKVVTEKSSQSEGGESVGESDEDGMEKHEAFWQYWTGNACLAVK